MGKPAPHRIRWARAQWVYAIQNIAINVLFVLALGAFGANSALAQPDCQLARPIAQAVRTVERAGQVIDRSVVTAIDRLERSWIREGTTVRYQVELPPCPPQTNQSLWVYRIGAPYRVSADGRALLAIHPFAPATSNVYNGRVPALFALPIGARSLEFELVTLAYVNSGLIRVEIGPPEALNASRAIDRGALTLFNDVSSAVIVFVGVFALLAWLMRRHEKQILWFGLACLVWALRGLAYQTFVVSAYPLGFELLNPTLVLITCACVAASTLYSMGAMTRRRGLALMAATALPLGGALASMATHSGAAAARSACFLTGFVLIASLVVMLWGKRAAGRSQVNLLLAGYVAMLAGAVHDLAMAASLIAPDGWSYVTPSFTVMLLCHAVTVSQYQVRNLNRAEHANEELEQTIRTKTSQLEASYTLLREGERESARTQEREHLLREMHDGIGAQLMTALRGVERGVLAREQVLAALQDSLDDLRMLMDSTDMGRHLPGALANWRNRWDPRLAALGLRLDWAVDDAVDSVALPPDAVLQLMRILQEATANAIKHAEATRIALRVTLDTTPQGAVLRLRLQDNGRGLPEHRASGGRGLRNMQSRAQLLGGQLTVHALAAPLSGTTVSISVALPTTP